MISTEYRLPIKTWLKKISVEDDMHEVVCEDLGTLPKKNKFKK